MITRAGYGNSPQTQNRHLKPNESSIQNLFKDYPYSISHNLHEPLRQAHGVSFKGSFIKTVVSEFSGLKSGKIVEDTVLSGKNKIAAKGFELLKQIAGDDGKGVVSTTLNYLKDEKNNIERTVLGDLLENCKSMTYRLALDAINMGLDVFNHIPGTKGKLGNQMRNGFPVLSNVLNNRRNAITNEANAYGIKGFVGWFENEYIKHQGNEKKLKQEIEKYFFKNAGNPNQMNFGAVADRVWARVISGMPSALFLANDAANLTTILKNDKKESDKEYKSRFVQEAGRVGLSAGLMFFTLGGLRKFTNKSMIANIGITLLSTFVAEVVGRKMAGKRILPMSKQQAEKLYGNNDTKEVKEVKVQNTLNPPKTTSFKGSSEKPQETKKGVNWFDVALKGSLGFVSTVAAVSILANMFKKSNLVHSSKDLAIIFEELKKQLPEKAEIMFKTIKESPENVLSNGKALNKEAFASLDSFIETLKTMGDQKVKIGEVPNRYVDAMVNKGFFFPIKLLSQDITGSVNGIGHYVKSRVDNIFASFASHTEKNKIVEKALSEKTDSMMNSLREKIGSDADKLIAKVLGSETADLSELVSKRNFKSFEKAINELINGKKAKILSEKFSEELVKLVEENKTKYTAEGLKELVKDAVFGEAKRQYVKELAEAAKANENIKFNGLHSLALKFLAPESSTAQITEMEKVKEILGKLKYDLKRAPNISGTQELDREKLGQQFKDTISTRLLPGWDFSRKPHFSGTELSTWVKFLGSGLSGFFLVSDAYNMVMEKTAGKDQDLARQKAQERAVQEVSRNLFSSYFVKFTNELFKPLYNLSLLGASAITVGNVVGYEALTRKAVGIPITRKSKEEILKSDADNQAKTGFWGDYYKFMSYVTGKKSLSSRVKPSETVKSATLETSKPAPSVKTSSIDLYNAIKQPKNS